MIDTTAFITALYVMVDDFCKSQPRVPRTPGRPPVLSQSEVITLTLFGQWRNFASEQDFYRYAQRHLRPFFPQLPDRSQFNRAQRRCYDLLVAFWQDLVLQLRPTDMTGYYEALDASAVATRFVRRRGGGWLPGQANKATGSRLGWYCGFYLLASADAKGVITGWAFGSASTKDQRLAESFLQARKHAHDRLPTVGPMMPEGGYYLTDSGFVGHDWHHRWRAEYHAEVITPPQRYGGWHPRPWEVPWKELRHWIASQRQIIESVFGKLHHAFRLRDERPHRLEGFMTRLAAKITLHNICILFNRRLGRPDLAFADLWSW